MKFKNYFIYMLVFCFGIACIMLSGFMFFKKQSVKNINNQQNTSYSTLQNKLWCVTFQLVWNDFMDKYTNSKPVKFEGGNPPIADELNKRLYTSDVLSEKSYYKTQGEISKHLKKEIEEGIYKKFKEKSDILDLINWNAKNSYLFYVMLKKDFTFIKPFIILPAGAFNSSKENVKYFGVDEHSTKDIKNTVDVLFYNSENDFAVKLLTKENEDVILYRTDKEDTFENLYNVIAKTKNKEKMNKKDTLKVPNITVDELISYNELCNKRIEGTNKVITNALQTIKFKMDNKGGSIKSEAALGLMRASLPIAEEKQRHYNFDKRFVLFLKEKGKDKPYYSMIIDDTTYLVKE